MHPTKQPSKQSKKRRSRKTLRRRTTRGPMSMERLQARELLAADFAWQDDALQITGSDDNDFIAVQQDSLGTKVFTADSVFAEHEGRSFDTATTISVSGGAGDDLLFNHQTSVFVNLSGDAGNDFVFSDTSAEGLDGGDGFDWVYGQQAQGLWENAFGVEGLTLNPSTLNGIPQFDEDNRISLQVEVGGETQIGDQAVEISGVVEVGSTGIDVSVTGAIDSWSDAFDINGLELTNTSLTLSAGTDVNEGNGYRVDLTSNMNTEGTDIGIVGSVGISEDAVSAAFAGTVANWDSAFGIPELDLRNVEMAVSGSVDANNSSELSFGIAAHMVVEETLVDVSGNVSIAPDLVDGQFHGSLDNWEDAFGITGLSLANSELNIAGYTNRSDEYGLHVDVLGAMDVDGTNVNVSGLVEVEPTRTTANLTGSVAADWTDAFRIDRLTLQDTTLTVVATRDDNAGSSLEIDIDANMDIAGADVAVSGTMDVNPDGTSGSLTGIVGGEWAGALGIVGLDLINTTIRVDVSRTTEGSEYSLGLGATMDLLGTNIAVDGTAAISDDGVSTSLTGLVDGEWVDAFGISALQLHDTSLTVSADSTRSGLDIDLDTDLALFGSYLDVIGSLDVSPSGIDVSFTPPGSLDFADLLGIPGFSLEDADLLVTAGASGLEASVFATMDMGVDVAFEGAFAISKTDVSASLTGRVDSWDNAFEVPGLNLDDIVMTLGAESGLDGASMFIGLGAGIDVGAKSIDVAGLVGVGATGWDVAFRGGIDSLTSVDLIDFANTISHAGNPAAPEIPATALGEFEMRDAYINFAPQGGNEALGIDDGFGIGGDFYEGGDLLAGGEFAIDLAQASFQVGLDIPELALGPVALSDVLMDIRIAPFDSYQKVAGTGELMGSRVRLAGELYPNGSFLLTGHGNVQIDGLPASAVFRVDNSGILFDATASGSAVDAIKGSVTGDLLAVANDAQAAIDQAQTAVNRARAEVRSLESDLTTARANAQQELDEVKADLDAAQSVVDSARSSMDYWYGVRKSRHTAWKRAVTATNRAAWYNKPYYKTIEAGKYASYVAANGTYTAKVGIYNASLVAYNAVRDAAGWALDAAGVEANPEVIRITAMLATSNLAVDVAESILNQVEEINSDALQYLSIADSLRVDKVTLSGDVANYLNAGVSARVEYSFAGQSHALTRHASTDDLVQQLADAMVEAII